MAVDDGCRPAVAGVQQPNGLCRAYIDGSNRIKVFAMLRTASLYFTAEGRLLGFDTGDWSMLIGGFFLAGLLALMV
jgi:hypothetical protein